MGRREAVTHQPSTTPGLSSGFADTSPLSQASLQTLTSNPHIFLFLSVKIQFNIWLKVKCWWTWDKSACSSSPGWPSQVLERDRGVATLGSVPADGDLFFFFNECLIFTWCCQWLVCLSKGRGSLHSVELAKNNCGPERPEFLLWLISEATMLWRDCPTPTYGIVISS